MMKIFLSKRLFLLSTIIIGHTGYSQNVFQFKEENFIPVFNSNDKQLDNPWDGGWSTAELSHADVNNDGINDLVAYEKTTMSVKVYIGTKIENKIKYIYNPVYEKNFPPYISSYMKLMDYNCDGIPDLFNNGGTGLSIHRGKYNSKNELTFDFYKNVFYNNNRVNVYSLIGDVPAIADLDGDGDLDVVTYDMLGGYMNHYVNQRVEQNLHCDSFVVNYVDKCWGKTYQGFDRAHRLGISCQPPQMPAHDDPSEDLGIIKDPIKSVEKGTHSGNTLTPVDFDGDGVYDMFNGNVSFSDIVYLVNGKKNNARNIDSIVSQDTVWKSNFKALNLDFMPKAHWFDYDQDGDKDLIFTPHADYSSADINNCVYFENTGHATWPDFHYRGDSLMVDQHIDVGTTAYPVLYDYNKDGYPDLLVANQNYYAGNGVKKSRLTYYRNVLVNGKRGFKLENKNLLNLESYNIDGFSIAIGDIDNDGKDDLVVGKNASPGRMMYFKNMAASNAQVPNWSLVTDELKGTNNQPLSVLMSARPFIADIDGDGKSDLIVGKYNGYVSFFKNITGGDGGFEKITDTLGKMFVPFEHPTGWFPDSYVYPYYGSVDTSRDKYFILGASIGTLSRYKAPSPSEFNPHAQFELIDTFFSNIKVTQNAAPVIGDMDRDGIAELYVGNYHGGINLYKGGMYPIQAGPNNIIQLSNSPIKIYPNPADKGINIDFYENAVGSCDLFNNIGQKIISIEINKNEKNYHIPTAHLSNGIYFLSIEYNGVSKKEKIIINR